MDRGRNKSLAVAALSILAVLTALLLCTATFAAEEHGAAHGGGHQGYSHEKKLDLLWRTMNFAVLAAVLVKFLKKPMGKMLTDRQAGIKQRFEELESKKVEVEKMYAEHEKKLATIEQEAKKVMQEYIEEGKAEKERIISEAVKAAEMIKKQAEFAIEQEGKRAKLALSAEVAEHSVKLAGDIIKKNLNQSDHQRLIDEYIAKVVHKN